MDISGIVYIADNGNNKIRMVASTGIITTFASTGTAGSSGDGGAATSAQLNNPYGVTVDISGNVYIADGTNFEIRMVTSTGIITTIAGTGGGGDGGDGGVATSAQLTFPHGVAVDISGIVYIADTYNNKIRMVVPQSPTSLPAPAPTQVNFFFFFFAYLHCLLFSPPHLLHDYYLRVICVGYAHLLILYLFLFL